MLQEWPKIQFSQQVNEYITVTITVHLFIATHQIRSHMDTNIRYHQLGCVAETTMFHQNQYAHDYYKDHLNVSMNQLSVRNKIMLCK